MDFQTYKQFVATIFFIDIAVLSTCFFRYVGTGYDPATWINNKFKASIFYLMWFSSTLLLCTKYSFFASACLLICLRHIHINRRFHSLARGAGAVGLMPYHTALYIFILEGCVYFENQHLCPAITFFYILDIALIMFDAGLYKCFSGYLSGHGVEYALVNPLWGRLWRLSKYYNLPFIRSLLSVSNIVGAIAELAASALLFYVYKGVALGGIIIGVIFTFVEIIIKLITLPILMMLIGYYCATNPITEIVINEQAWETVMPFGVLYMTVQLFCKLVQYSNYFLKRKFSSLIQKTADFISKHLPVSIWRVFTADITSNYIDLKIIKKNGEKIKVFGRDCSYWSSNAFVRNKIRYLFVTESVVLSTLASYWRYAPSETNLIQDRLIQYTKTLDENVELGDAVVYTYNVIKKNHKGELFDKPIIQWYVKNTSLGYEFSQQELVENPWENAMMQKTYLNKDRKYGSYI